MATASAYRSGHYSLAAIGRHFGIHYSTGSRAARHPEEKRCYGNARPEPYFFAFPPSLRSIATDVLKRWEHYSRLTLFM